MVLEASRPRQPKSELKEAEKSQFRTLISQMGWVARQSRPDIMVMVHVSMAAPSHGLGRRELAQGRKETSDAKWRFVPSGLKLEDCVGYSVSPIAAVLPAPATCSRNQDTWLASRARRSLMEAICPSTCLRP